MTRSDAPGFAALLGAWRADPQLTKLVVLKTESITAPHAALHAALRSAEPPSADEVAAWIHSRTESDWLSTAVLGAIAPRPSLSRSGRHGRFSKSGPLRAKGWTDAFRLAQALSHPGGATVEAIAGAVDRCVRTLDNISKRRMGMRLTRARTAFGWRWAVEHILRLHGYMEEREPVSLAAGLPSAQEIEHVRRLANKRKALTK